MKQKSMYALIALVLGGSAAVVHAEDYSNPYFAPRLGVVLPDSDRETKDSLLAGLGVGWWVNPNFAVDFEYTINNAKFKSHSIRDGHQWENVGLDIAGRWFLGDEGAVWRPYLMGGIGTQRHAAVSGFIHHNGWDPLATLGGGVQYNMSDRIAVRGEIAARYDRDNNSSGFAHLKSPANHYLDALASVALVVNFGGAATPSPPPVPGQSAVAPPPPPPPPPVEPPPPPKPVEPTLPEKVVIDLRGINFKFDRPQPSEKNVGPTLAEPTSDSLAILDQAVDVLKRYPNVRVEVDGHTDSIGTEEYNQKLSERRARIVYDYLTSHGVDMSRLDGPKGFGELRPIDTNSTKQGRARNRRVELTVENSGSR